LIYWHLFLAFFVPSIVGYGGGPAFIPLIQNEVTNRYGWYTVDRFGELLAIANALPGPIATKMAGYIGYEQAGFMGSAIALFATVAPSLLAMILLLGLLLRFKDSPKVQRMTGLVKPTIAVLMGVLSYQLLFAAWHKAGTIHTLVLLAAGFILMEKFKVQPVYVILGALVYGGLLIR
jgi:chromate transporter